MLYPSAGPTAATAAAAAAASAPAAPAAVRLGRGGSREGCQQEQSDTPGVQGGEGEILLEQRLCTNCCSARFASFR